MTISRLSADCLAEIYFRAFSRLELLSWSALFNSVQRRSSGAKDQKVRIPISILFLQWRCIISTTQQCL